MKIAILTNTRPHEGGVTTYINNAAFSFRQLGNDVDVLTIFGNSRDRKVKSTFVKFTDPILKGKGLKAVIAYLVSTFVLLICLLIVSIKKIYDVYYAIDVSAANVVICLGQKFKQKLFLRVGASVTFDLLAQNKIKKDSWYHRFFINQELRAYRNTVKIIPHGSWSYNYIKTMVPESNINDPIFNPVNVQFFNKNTKLRKEMRKSWGYENDDFVILFPGRLDYRKGAHILIAALGKLVEKSKIFKAVILGIGPEEIRIKELIKSMDLEAHIIMPGVISHQEMPQYYSGADCFVLPSLPVGEAEDAMPNSALEAMASRLPVVTSSIGGLRDFINHGRDGYLISYGDIVEFSNHLEELATSRKKCIKVGNKARSKIIEHCSQKTIAEKLIQIFNKN